MVTGNTRNLSDFGFRELNMAREILNEMVNNGLPDDFENNGVSLEFNPHSGNVFLVNEEYQTAMLNGNKLETWYYLPYSGEEGFKEDFEGRDKSDFNEEDVEYLIDIGVFEPDEDEED